jgi:hypothetical protein
MRRGNLCQVVVETLEKRDVWEKGYLETTENVAVLESINLREGDPAALHHIGNILVMIRMSRVDFYDRKKSNIIENWGTYSS